MSDFVKAVTAAIMEHEVIHTRTGQVVSYQCIPSDKGNYRNGQLLGTNWGVSAVAAPASILTREDMEKLILPQAIVQVYQPRYGEFAALENQRVLIKAVDLAINMEYNTHGPATRILQTAANVFNRWHAEDVDQLLVDGVLGPLTIDTCNALASENEYGFLKEICDAALAYYKLVEVRNPGQQGWFNNWNNRAVWLPPVTVEVT